MHLRKCKECGRIYKTPAKHSKKCPDCWKTNFEPYFKQFIEILPKPIKEVDKDVKTK